MNRYHFIAFSCFLRELIETIEMIKTLTFSRSKARLFRLSDIFKTAFWMSPLVAATLGNVENLLTLVLASLRDVAFDGVASGALLFV